MEKEQYGIESHAVPFAYIMLIWHVIMDSVDGKGAALRCFD